MLNKCNYYHNRVIILLQLTFGERLAGKVGFLHTQGSMGPGSQGFSLSETHDHRRNTSSPAVTCKVPEKISIGQFGSHVCL